MVGRGVKSQLLCLVTGLAFVLSNKACLCEEWGGLHMMKQSAGLVLTTLNGFIIVWSGNRCCVVLFVIHYMSVPQCYRHAKRP